MPKKYHLIYDIELHPDGLTREEVPEGHAGADALILTSLIYGEDGSTSFGLASVDGRTGEQLDIDELFSAWCIMARHLADCETLSQGKKAMAGLVFDTMRTAVLDAHEARARGPAS